MTDIDAITVAVYRARLDDACPGDADRMVAKDNDGGLKQRRRALKAYGPVVLETLRQAGVIARPAPPKRKADAPCPSSSS